jgi:hypothetical protein
VGSRAPLTARAAALAYAGVGVYATRVAIAHKEPARFAGRSYPGPAAYQFLWVGTALSAPVYILGGYVRAGLSGNERALRVLAAATFAGQLGEPITWRAVGRARAIVAANLVLPAIIMLSLRHRPRAGSRP